MNIDFKVIARVKTEDKEGVIYQARLKSREGHRLILKFPNESAINGFALGERITVQIKNPQKTLEA